MKPQSIRLPLAGVLLFILVFSGWIDRGHAEWQLSIEPRVTGAVRYDSNFFKTPDNEREVITYLVAPAIGLEAESAKLKLRLDYTLEAYFYDDVDSLDEGEQSVDDQDYVGHLVAFNSRYTATSRLTVGLDDTFYLTRYPFNYDRLSDSTDRRKYWINRLTPLVYYDFENRFSAGLRFRRTDIDYDDTEQGDLVEHRLFVDLLYNPTRSTTVDFGYQWWDVDYEADGATDYESNQLKLIFEKRYTYYAFDAGIGYHYRDFDNASFSSDDTVAWLISVTGQNPPPPETTRFQGSAFLRAKSHFYLAVEHNFNNLGFTFEQYTALRYTASAGHVFFDRFLARLKGYYQESDYKESSREDETFNVSASLEYLLFQRANISAVAGYEERDSNDNTFDYDNTYYVLRFDYNYDIASRGGHSEEGLYY